MRQSDQLLQAYRERSSLGDDVEMALVRLYVEKVPFIQVVQVITGVYDLHFDDAVQKIHVYSLWRDELHSSDIVTQLICEYQKRFEQGESIEQAIIRLHEQNVELGNAVKTLRGVYHLKIVEARNLLFEHPVWSKEREFSEDVLHQIFNEEDVSKL